MKKTAKTHLTQTREPEPQSPPRVLPVRTQLRAGKWSMSGACNDECLAACQDAGHDAGWCAAMRCEEWPEY